MTYNFVDLSLLLIIHDIPGPINFSLLKIKKSLKKSDILSSKLCSSTKCFSTIKM